jgi:LacI family transcriptional regulator
VGALRSLRDRGLRVPDDVSVIGFDNIKLSEFCYPALTTVHIPRDHIGHIISDILTMRRRRTATAEREIAIEPELLVRDSTGRAVE